MCKIVCEIACEIEGGSKMQNIHLPVYFAARTFQQGFCPWTALGAPPPDLQHPATGNSWIRPCQVVVSLTYMIHMYFAFRSIGNFRLSASAVWNNLKSEETGKDTIELQFESGLQDVAFKSVLILLRIS